MRPRLQPQHERRGARSAVQCAGRRYLRACRVITNSEEGHPPERNFGCILPAACGINGIEKDGSENRDRADRKSRAELRRAGSVASDGGDAINLIRAYGIESFHVFLPRTQEKAPWIEPERAALAAITLAHVDHDLDLDEEVKAHTARLLGRPRSADSKEPKFAEARFKRLIRTDDPAELLPQMVRAVKILGKTAPVGELGASLLRWGPDVRKHWAFAYWQKKYVSAEPSEQTETQDAA